MQTVDTYQVLYLPAHQEPGYDTKIQVVAVSSQYNLKQRFCKTLYTCAINHHVKIFYILSSQVSVVGKKMFITPRYAQNQATFISTVTTFNDTGIYFGAGRGQQRLLEVPLIPAGRFTRNESIAIQITAVLNGGMLNQRDRDPIVGITDGSRINVFRINDINNYPSSPPCFPASASGTLSKTFSTGPVPDQFTFLLKPAERFGACSSAIHGGYVNVGIFNNQLDLSRGINLQIRKEDSYEDYLFYYFLVEIFQ